ncbi:MAG: OsmC family protein [Thermocladium sp.]
MAGNHDSGDKLLNNNILPPKATLEKTIDELRSNGGGSTDVEISARLIKGIRTEVKVGDHTLYIDGPPSLGGTDTAPRPSAYALVSLAGCLTMMFAWHASLNDIKIDSLNITIRGSHDLLPMFDPETGWPGLKNVEVEVNVSTDKPEELSRLLNVIKDGSPVTQTFIKPIPVRLRTVINKRRVRDEVVMV